MCITENTVLGLGQSKNQELNELVLICYRIKALGNIKQKSFEIVPHQQYFSYQLHFIFKHCHHRVRDTRRSMYLVKDVKG